MLKIWRRGVKDALGEQNIKEMGEHWLFYASCFTWRPFYKSSNQHIYDSTTTQLRARHVANCLSNDCRVRTSIHWNLISTCQNTTTRWIISNSYKRLHEIAQMVEWWTAELEAPGSNLVTREFHDFLWIFRPILQCVTSHRVNEIPIKGT